MKNITSLINTALSRELQALLYFLGYCSQQEAYKVYAVGGFVRDLLLDQENRDIDLVVEGNAVKFAKSLLKVMPGTLRCYERFGTATLVLPQGIVFDMVTAREEFYLAPGALPTVQRSTLKNDLFRRDFTINTMACALNPEEFGMFFDYFGGWEDLQKGSVKVLYRLSFVDDPLRMLRAIRFEQRYGFTIEEDSLTLLKKAIKNRLWEKVSKERFYNEARLIFREPKPSRVLARCAELNMFKGIFPRIAYNAEIENRLQRLEGMLAEVCPKEPPGNLNRFILYLSALFYGLREHDVKHISYMMRLKRKERRDLFYIKENLPRVLLRLKRGAINPSDLFFLLQKMPEEGLLLALSLDPEPRIREKISYYREHLRGKKPFTTGKDLLGAGIRPGPVYNKILTKLHEAVLEGTVNGKKEELEFLNVILENESARK